MGSFNDPHAVGQLIGAAAAAGAVGYFVARKAFPHRRTARVARLMRDAGVEEDGGRPRGWRPPPALVGVGMACLALVWTAAGIARQGFSADDLPQLRAGLVEGCKTRCAKEGAAPDVCTELCNCARVELESHRPSDDEMVQWFNAVTKKDDRALRQWSGAQSLCVERASAQQP